MKCQNCGIEIPPLWTASLRSNICPSCGKAIMSTEIQELINGLSEAMEKMPNNPQGVSCWLVSNYKLEKINDYEPPQFHQAKKVANINSNSTNSEKQKSVEDFFARAGASISKKKAIPSAIKPIENDDIDDYIEDSNDENSIVETSSELSSELSDSDKDGIGELIRLSKFEKNPILIAQIEAQRQKQENIANGIAATDRRGRPAGFRRSE